MFAPGCACESVPASRQGARRSQAVNQIKSQRKATIPHKKRESDEKNAVAIVIIVPQLGCVSQDSSALVSHRGKQPWAPDAKSLGFNSKKHGSLSLRYVKQVSGKRKDHPWGKIQVEPQHQRSPYAMKFEDRSHEETGRQQRCARSKAENLAQKIHKLKANDKATLACREVGNAGYVNKRTGGKRVCGRFRSECAYGQQTRPQLC